MRHLRLLSLLLVSLLVVPPLLVLTGCAGSSGGTLLGAKAPSPNDPGYCQSIGLTIGSDRYAECRMRQSRNAPDR